MREFNNRKKLKRLLYSKLSIILLIIILFFTARASFFLFLKQNESQQKEEKAKAELSLLKSRKEVLEREVERLSTEGGIEEEIRDKFKLAKEDESVVVIINNEEEKIIPEEKISFFESIRIKIANFFTGKK